MELRLPLEMSPGREAACRAVFGTWGFFSERCTEKLPLRVDFIHRVEFGEVSGHRVLFFNDTATTEIYTLSLHDALPIYL